jgi:hypothetical protein
MSGYRKLMPKMCKIVVRSRTFRYFRRNSEPCLLSQVKKIVCFLFCWRQFTAATGCSLQLYSTAHPAPDTTLRCSACSRVKTCGSSETVYLLALPSSVRSFCVTRTNGIRSVLKIITDFQNSSYQILWCCMQWTTTADRVCDAHFAKHNRESLSAISTSILIAVWKKSRNLN